MDWVNGTDRRSLKLISSCVFYRKAILSKLTETIAYFICVDKHVNVMEAFDGLKLGRRQKNKMGGDVPWNLNIEEMQHILQECMISGLCTYHSAKFVNKLMLSFSATLNFKRNWPDSFSVGQCFLFGRFHTLNFHIHSLTFT